MPHYLENGEKSGNFIKLTDWQSPIERTSHQFLKKNLGNSGLESRVWDFSPDYLFFNSQESTNRLSDYCSSQQSLKFLIAKFHKTLDCRLRISGFPDLMVISKNKYV